jgi:hypothetical protein
MSISLTCSCGARLEIDDKFAGKTIPCPDCQQPLNTLTASPAPKDLPVSGLALASLTLALVGAFLPPVSLAAIALGVLAVRQIAHRPDRVGGLNFARAGMALGGVFTFIALAAYMSGDVMGVDSLLRQFYQAETLEHKMDAGGIFKIKQSNLDHDFGIQRPSSSWAKLKPKGSNQKDLLTLVDLRDDAHLVCLDFRGEDEQSAIDKAAERLRGSDLFKNLSKPSDTRGQTPEPEAKKVPNSPNEMTLDVQLGGYPRTFLMRVVKMPKGGDILLLAAGTRAARFSRLVDEFRRSFDSFKLVEE